MFFVHQNLELYDELVNMFWHQFYLIHQFHDLKRYTYVLKFPVLLVLELELLYQWHPYRVQVHPLNPLRYILLFHLRCVELLPQSKILSLLKGFQSHLTMLVIVSHQKKYLRQVLQPVRFFQYFVPLVTLSFQRIYTTDNFRYFLGNCGLSCFIKLKL